MSANDTMPHRGRVVFVGLMAAQAGLLAYAATRHAPSIDEAAHLPAGISHWVLGRYELYAVNPPLVRSVAALPVLLQDPILDWDNFEWQIASRSEFQVGRDFITRNGKRSIWFYTVGRWACIPFSLLGGWICYLWARELYGWQSGLFALSLWCFSPTILANGQLLTPDLGAAALGVAACYLFRRWILCPEWSAAILAGIVLGCAQASKTTWVVLFLLWPAIWIVWRASDRIRSQKTANRLRQSAVLGSLQLSAILGVALFTINVWYGFDDSFQPLGKYRFVSATLRGESNSGNRFHNSILERVPVPVPRDYLLGIDLQKRDFENGYPSYLFEEWKEGGWWYYYLVALAVKVPLGAWVLVIIAAVLRLTRFRKSMSWHEDALLLTPGLLILALVSSQTGFNHHMRYVLPMFPFVVIWTSQVVCQIEKHRTRKAVVGAAWIWFAGSSLWYYPHNLSYFNELVGGPLGGHRVLVDSNIDWGQDLLYLKQWYDAHPEARPFHLAYFGETDPSVLGIEFRLPPKMPTDYRDNAFPESESANLGPRPGWHAISVSVLRGLEFRLYIGDGTRENIGDEAYTYFREFEPIARAGYSIYIYHVTLADANRVRRKLGLPELKDESPSDK